MEMVSANTWPSRRRRPAPAASRKVTVRVLSELQQGLAAGVEERVEEERAVPQRERIE